MRQEPLESFPNEAGKWTVIQDVEGTTGLFLSCIGTLVFLWSGDWCFGELLELHQGSRTLSSLRGNVGFLLKSHSRKGLHLVLWGESPGFSLVAARNLGLLSSYGRDLMDPLVWPQESPESLRVARGLSGFLSRRYRVLGPHLDLR